MSDEPEKNDPKASLNYLYWRDEILQLMYWMTGEGFGQRFDASDLRKFLAADDDTLAHSLDAMVSEGLLERAGDRHALTELGKTEGARRFADEFEAMLRPGHFECDEPDCDCHSAESSGEVCKRLLPADSRR